MYEKPRVNVKVERGSTFTFTRGFSYITSISIYARKASSSLRPYARKNYATVEIHLKAIQIFLNNLNVLTKMRVNDSSAIFNHYLRML